MTRSDAPALRSERTPYPSHPEAVPEWEDRFGRYRVSFARRAHELEEVLRLRFDVFNVELGHGPVGARRDEDVFDSSCHHLLVRCERSGDVVGTYRFMTREQASSGPGFYAGAEFDLAPLADEILDRGVELGRACIARAHRGRRVLFLLWRGIGRYLEHNRKRYLFGCASLPSLDPRRIAPLDDGLRRAPTRGLPWLPVRPDYRRAPEVRDPDDEPLAMPSLLRGYLQLGAVVCGGPAYDTAFRTTDYFMLLDAEKIPQKTYNRYVR